MTDFDWQPKKINVSRLLAEMRAASLPISYIGWAEDLTIHYHWQTYPTPAQQQAAAEIVAAHNPAVDTTETKRIISEQLGYGMEKRIEAAETSIKDISTKAGKSV